MITTNRYRSLNLSALNKIIDRLAHLRALPIAKPTDSRGQALKLNAISSQPQPAIQRSIFRKQLQREVIGLANVVWVTRQRDPAKRPFAFAEKRPDVFGDEAGNIKRIVTACIKRLLANVVAVI